MCDWCATSVRGLTSRRGFLVGAVAAAGAAAGAFPLARPAFAQAANGVPPDEAQQRLVDGNARYVAGQTDVRDFEAGRAARATSQHPFASVLSCADSRVAPELAFDQGAGDLFVVRVAGNIANDDAVASLEFGSAVLGCQLILVLGHTSCGAVVSAIGVVKEKTELPGHLPGLIGQITPAVETAMKDDPADLVAAATVQNVRDAMARLSADSPMLSGLIAEGKLKVIGGIYELSTGKVSLLT